MTSRTLHMGATIPFLIELCRTHPDEEIITGLKGNAAIAALRQAQAEGIEIVPFSPCDNQEPDGRCAGPPA